MAKLKKIDLDEITGLPNIIALDKKLKEIRSEKTFFMIDILFFSDINENYGYENGNIILNKFTQNCLKVISLKVIIDKVHFNLYHIYSDKFVLVSDESLNEKNIKKISTFLVNEISKKNYYLNDSKFNLEITIGISKGYGNIGLIKKSEEALFRAKSLNLKFYFNNKSEENPQKLYNNLDLLQKIKQSIKQKNIFPLYQPIIDNTTGKVFKYEALMRLKYVDEKNIEHIIYPNTFIEFSKRTRFYSILMTCMVKKVLNDVLKYNFNVSINFSFEDIMNENLVKYIKNFLKKHNLGYKITFEIVESEQINENSIIKTFFKDIKKLHCSLSIDDFGSGYSNYDQLLNRNTDYLKIDGSLINKYKEKNYENMIKSIVYFCKKSGIKVVAEFVDNEEKQKFIKKWNIDFSQGYYFSKPISIQEIFGEKK